jgi:hypothetical protein
VNQKGFWAISAVYKKKGNHERPENGRMLRVWLDYKAPMITTGS